MAYATRRPKSAAMQAAVLRLLCDLGSVSVKELCYFTGASAATVRHLADLGYVNLTEREVLRCRQIRPAQVEVLRQSDGNAVLSIVIHEGKNRQIRRMCAACGLKVSRLRRVAEHTLSLGSLPLGKWRHLTTEEVAALKKA